MYHPNYQQPLSNFMGNATHHLTLPHKHNSIPIRPNMWMFPEVINARMMKIMKRKAKAPSTMRRKVGCSEDPGFRMLEMKLERLS